MPVYQVKDPATIAGLYAGWQETMIWSCLQGCMGTAYADNLASPSSAQIILGGFAFFAGQPNHALLQNNPGGSCEMLAPQNSAWEKAIELVYKQAATRHMRYATKKEPDCFDTEALRGMAAALPAPYRLQLIGRQLYDTAMAGSWAADLCFNFGSYSAFAQNGLGVAVLKGEELVAGASSYTYYRGGIEIEIDTRRDERRKGLATACGAQLILECLQRGLYPSWDAHSKASLALAEKLGYHFDKEYPVYLLTA